MTPNLLDELEKIVALSEKATPGEWSLWGSPNPSQTIQSPDKFVMQTLGGNDVPNAKAVCAALNFLRTHAPALADMAKRMEAAERDSRRLDWLETYREAYGFQNEHLGNRWHIEGAYRSVRDALDDEMRGSDAIDATQEGAG